MSSYSQSSWPQWAYTAEVNDSYPAYGQYPNYSSYLADSMEVYQAHHQHLVHHHQMSRTTESKPRLSKEEVEVLEAEFQKNHKPNSSTKKALAESMRVDNARINNWFQNRRAREKKERNIREYEARQKLEKEKNHADGHAGLQPDRVSDLVASSAPFPNAHSSPQANMDARSTSLGLDQDSEVATQYLSDENAGSGQLSSGFLRTPTAPGTNGFFARNDCTSPSNDTSDTNDQEFALSTDDEDTNYYVQQMQHTYRGGEKFRRFKTELGGDLDDLTEASFAHASGDDADSLGSSSADIATRRNRRPPPLAIGGPRSYSVGVPKTAVDVSKRGDSMRRVASATGPIRVTKPMAAPRSPFQPSRSPAPAAVRGSRAPPTPDTPVLANQPSTASTGSIDPSGAISVSELAIRDPTLRTPPTTPGVVQSYFSLDSVYDMPMAGQNLINSSMANFQSDYEANKLPVGIPGYIGNPSSGVNPAQTPSFVSPGAQSSMGLSSANTEYNWPASVGSRHSSPVEQQQGSHFLSIQAPSFGMLDR